MTTLAQEAQVGFEQCVVFVEHVTGIGYGLPTAASYLSTYKGALHSAPQVGDIAIWGANQGGALSAGHVAVVTGLSPSGQVTVTGTNWPGGSGARSNVVGTGGMGSPTAFLSPKDVGGSAVTASPDVTGGAGATSTFAAATPGSGWSIGPWKVLSGSALSRTAFTLVGIALIGIGAMVLLRRDIPAAIGKVTTAA